MSQMGVFRQGRSLSHYETAVACNAVEVIDLVAFLRYSCC